MPKLAIWVEMEAKAGKEQELAEFLKSAQALAEKEPGDDYVVRDQDGRAEVWDFRYVRGGERARGTS